MALRHSEEVEPLGEEHLSGVVDAHHGNETLPLENTLRDRDDPLAAHCCPSVGLNAGDTNALSDERYLNTATPHSSDANGDTRDHEGDGFGHMTGHSWQTENTTAGMDIETSRKLFLTRLSLEDAVNSLEVLEGIISGYIAALEGRHNPAFDSRTESSTVDPFKLSKRPLEDVAEDLCNRVQAVITRLEKCSEIQKVLYPDDHSRCGRKETSAFVEPFVLLNHQAGDQMRSDLSVCSADGKGNGWCPATPSTSGGGDMHTTFGPLVDTFQLDSTVPSAQMSNQASDHFTATFGPMVDTFSSEFLNSYVATPNTNSDGSSQRQASESIGVNPLWDALSQLRGQLRGSGAVAPLVPGLPVGVANNAATKTAKDDVLGSNPSQWLLRVPSYPGALPPTPAASLPRQASTADSSSCQHMDPSDMAAVSSPTCADSEATKCDSSVDKQEANVHASPPAPATAPHSDKSQGRAGGATREAPVTNVNARQCVTVDQMSEEQLRRYVKQLEAALSPEQVLSLGMSVQ